ncbi:hypothetical protein P692DRAFT_20878558 [Suillus brevipes Sb2]|nr:hypothetical protein P692DRAFT_20878558 [Suillus brevipes Sb2]
MSTLTNPLFTSQTSHSPSRASMSIRPLCARHPARTSSTTHVTSYARSLSLSLTTGADDASKQLADAPLHYQLCLLAQSSDHPLASSLVPSHISTASSRILLCTLSYIHRTHPHPLAPSLAPSRTYNAPFGDALNP